MALRPPPPPLSRVRVARPAEDASSSLAPPSAPPSPAAGGASAAAATGIAAAELCPQQAAAAQGGAGLAPGDVLSGRWLLGARLGKGAFGETFEVDGAADASLAGRVARLAVKVEPRATAPVAAAGGGEGARTRPQVLRNEAAALQRLQRSAFVPRFVESGQDAELGVSYLVMSRHGENLSRLARRRSSRQLAVDTLLAVAVECVSALRSVHELGFVHRDVKPSNFVLSEPSQRRRGARGEGGGGEADGEGGGEDEGCGGGGGGGASCILIDFGLARCFVDRHTGLPLPERRRSGFRGTPRYASLNVHAQRDAGRVDDLWSLLYMLVELGAGELPWSGVRDRGEVQRLKEAFTASDHLVDGLPRSFLFALHALRALAFADTPPYAELVAAFMRDLRPPPPPASPPQLPEPCPLSLHSRAPSLEFTERSAGAVSAAASAAAAAAVAARRGSPLEQCSGRSDRTAHAAASPPPLQPPPPPPSLPPLGPDGGRVANPSPSPSLSPARSSQRSERPQPRAHRRGLSLEVPSARPRTSPRARGSEQGEARPTLRGGGGGEVEEEEEAGAGAAGAAASKPRQSSSSSQASLPPSLTRVASLRAGAASPEPGGELKSEWTATLGDSARGSASLDPSLAAARDTLARLRFEPRPPASPAPKQQLHSPLRLRRLQAPRRMSSVH